MVDELDLIEEDDQITHTITLEDPLMPENELSKLIINIVFLTCSLLVDFIHILNSLV